MTGRTRPRVFCPGCGRSIAVTFNKRTGDAYIRSHVVKRGQRCARSGMTVPAALRDEPPFEMHWKGLP